VETKGWNCVIAGNPIISYIALGRDVDKDLISVHIHSVIIETLLTNFDSVVGEMTVTEFTAAISCSS
jgi:hypothetical protein